MEKFRIIEPDEVGIVLGISGNRNIGLIFKALKDDIVKQKEDKHESILSAPHFYAWLSIYCDYFTNGLFFTYYRLFGRPVNQKDIFKDNIPIETIVEKLKEYHKENPSLLTNKGLTFDNVMQHVWTIVEIRHCFRHGGVPNIIRNLNHATELEIKEILCPSNFKKTISKIKIANAFLKTLPQQSLGR